MKLGAILVAIVLACAALAATYWLTQHSTAAPAPVASTEPSEPVPSKTGPHPKAVVPETTYEFGAMRMGDSQEHIFVVRNEGEAPLLLGTPRTTCQCTVSEAAKKPIPPGGEGTIKLTWTPTAETSTFDKGAIINTNDPKMPEIRLAVVGSVEALLKAEPEGIWTVGDVTGNKEVEIAGYVFSRLVDEFKIESIESSNPLLTAEATPIEGEELKQHNAKSAYKITLNLSPGMPIGKFKESLTVQTDINDTDAARLQIPIQGTRLGPLQILPTPGVAWNPDALALDLRQFDASQGASATLSLFVLGLPEEEEFKFESVTSSDPSLEVSLKRDESFKAQNRQRYELIFRVPPGKPAVTHRAKGAVKVTVKTNHPEATEMKFFVEYISKP